VPLDDFAQAVQRFAQQGGRGCNITVPFKRQAAQCASTCSPQVQRATAANTLTFKEDGSIHADNTDGIGLIADIERNAQFPLAGCALLLVGAGGGAAGALAPLLAAGVAHITLTNRTLEKAKALVASHAALAQQYHVELQVAPLQALQRDFDLIINATASSLAGDSVPLPPHVLRSSHSLVYDMMYGPSALGFLQWATEHKAVARDGLGMLVEQAAESFHIWHGVRPPSAQVLAELRSA